MLISHDFLRLYVFKFKLFYIDLLYFMQFIIQTIILIHGQNLNIINYNVSI